MEQFGMELKFKPQGTASPTVGAGSGEPAVEGDGLGLLSSKGLAGEVVASRERDRLLGIKEYTPTEQGRAVSATIAKVTKNPKDADKADSVMALSQSTGINPSFVWDNYDDMMKLKFGDNVPQGHNAITAIANNAWLGRADYNLSPYYDLYYDYATGKKHADLSKYPDMTQEEADLAEAERINNEYIKPSLAQQEELRDYQDRNLLTKTLEDFAATAVPTGMQAVQSALISVPLGIAAGAIVGPYGLGAASAYAASLMMDGIDVLGKTKAAIGFLTTAGVVKSYSKRRSFYNLMNLKMQLEDGREVSLPQDVRLADWVSGLTSLNEGLSEAGFGPTGGIVKAMGGQMTSKVFRFGAKSKLNSLFGTMLLFGGNVLENVGQDIEQNIADTMGERYYLSKAGYEKDATGADYLSSTIDTAKHSFGASLWMSATGIIPIYRDFKTVNAVRNYARNSKDKESFVHNPFVQSVRPEGFSKDDYNDFLREAWDYKDSSMGQRWLAKTKETLSAAKDKLGEVKGKLSFKKDDAKDEKSAENAAKPGTNAAKSDVSAPKTEKTAQTKDADAVERIRNAGKETVVEGEEAEDLVKQSLGVFGKPEEEAAQPQTQEISESERVKREAFGDNGLENPEGMARSRQNEGNHNLQHEVVQPKQGEAVKESQDGSQEKSMEFYDTGNDGKKHVYGRISYTQHPNGTIEIPRDGIKLAPSLAQTDQKAGKLTFNLLVRDMVTALSMDNEGSDIFWHTGDEESDISKTKREIFGDRKSLGYGAENKGNLNVKTARTILKTFPQVKRDEASIAGYIIRAIGRITGLNVNDLIKAYRPYDGTAPSELDENRRNLFMQGRFRGLTITSRIAEKVQDRINAIVWATRNGDFSTFIHESMHLAEVAGIVNQQDHNKGMFLDALYGTIGKWADAHKDIFKFESAPEFVKAGIKNGTDLQNYILKYFEESIDTKWNDVISEAQARFSEAYAADRHNSAVDEKDSTYKPILKKLHDFMAGIYQSVKDNKVEVPENMRKVFDAAFMNKMPRKDKDGNKSVFKDVDVDSLKETAAKDVSPKAETEAKAEAEEKAEVPKTEEAKKAEKKTSDKKKAKTAVKEKAAKEKAEKKTGMKAKPKLQTIAENLDEHPTEGGAAGVQEAMQEKGDWKGDNTGVMLQQGTDNQTDNPETAKVIADTTITPKEDGKYEIGLDGKKLTFKCETPEEALEVAKALATEKRKAEREKAENTVTEGDPQFDKLADNLGKAFEQEEREAQGKSKAEIDTDIKTFKEFQQSDSTTDIIAEPILKGGEEGFDSRLNKAMGDAVKALIDGQQTLKEKDEAIARLQKELDEAKKELERGEGEAIAQGQRKDIQIEKLEYTLKLEKEIEKEAERELKEQSAADAKWDIKRKDNEIEKLEYTLKLYKELLGDAEAEKGEQAEEIGKLNNSIGELNKAKNELDKSVAALKEHIAEKVELIKTLNTTIETLNKGKDSETGKKGKEDARIKRLEAERDKAKAKVAEGLQKLADVRKALAEEKAQRKKVIEEKVSKELEKSVRMGERQERAKQARMKALRDILSYDPSKDNVFWGMRNIFKSILNVLDLPAIARDSGNSLFSGMPDNGEGARLNGVDRFMAATAPLFGANGGYLRGKNGEIQRVPLPNFLYGIVVGNATAANLKSRDKMYESFMKSIAVPVSAWTKEDAQNVSKVLSLVLSEGRRIRSQMLVAQKMANVELANEIEEEQIRMRGNKTASPEGDSMFAKQKRSLKNMVMRMSQSFANIFSVIDAVEADKDGVFHTMLSEYNKAKGVQMRLNNDRLTGLKNIIDGLDMFGKKTGTTKNDKLHPDYLYGTVHVGYDYEAQTVYGYRHSDGTRLEAAETEGVNFTRSQLMAIWMAAKGENQNVIDAIKYGVLMTFDDKQRVAERKESGSSYSMKFIWEQEELAENAMLRAAGQAGISKPHSQIDFERVAEGRWLAVLNAANEMMEEDPRLKKVVEYIQSDFKKSFPVINEATRRVFNVDMYQDPNYFPLQRLFWIYGGDESQSLLQQLNDPAFINGMAGIERGFTKDRQTIGELNQTAVNLDLINVYARHVLDTDHLVAFADWGATYNSLFNGAGSEELRNTFNKYFGNHTYKYLKDWVAEAINPEQAKARQPHDQMLAFLRGSLPASILAYNTSVIVTQALTSWEGFMPALGKEGMGDYFKNLFTMKQKRFRLPLVDADGAIVTDEDGGTVYRDVDAMEYVRYLSSQMESRDMDLDMAASRALREGHVYFGESAEGKMSKARDVFDKVVNQWGLAGLTAIDHLEVYAGWLTLYEKKMRELEAQGKGIEYADMQSMAIEYADYETARTQPSGDRGYASPFYKKFGNIGGILTMFTSSLNIVFNNLVQGNIALVNSFRKEGGGFANPFTGLKDGESYLLPDSARKQIMKKALTTFAWTAITGVLVGLVKSGYDDDDEPKDKVKKTGYWLLSQSLETLPLFGNAAEDALWSMLTGESWNVQNSMSVQPFRGPSDIMQGLYKMAEHKESSKITTSGPFMFLSGLGTMMGLPTTETKRVIDYVSGQGDMSLWDFLTGHKAGNAEFGARQKR